MDDLDMTTHDDHIELDLIGSLDSYNDLQESIEVERGRDD